MGLVAMAAAWAALEVTVAALMAAVLAAESLAALVGMVAAPGWADVRAARAHKQRSYKWLR